MLDEIKELNDLLKYADISQAELARQFKVSKMSVSKWLNGKSVPTKKKIANIRDFLAKFKGVMKQRGMKTLKKAINLNKDTVVNSLIEFWSIHRNFDANIRGLSKYTGVTPGTVYKWLNRKSYPKPAKIRLIDEWLNK